MALDGAILAALLQACAPNVAPQTMIAVIQVESQGDPFRIGVNSGGSLQRQPANAADAIATARGLLRRGANFDAGLMQINSANFARLGLAPETIFDPCTNLRAGARVLADNYRRARAAGHPDPLKAAISEYNTGSRSNGLQNGYVNRVYSAAGQSHFAGLVTTSPRLPQDAGRSVAAVIARAFDARITDTVRPLDASYGAENSYHKFGQAVDFVPRAGLRSITRDQIRAVLTANSIKIIELLGPGDPGHADHWHVAFAVNEERAPPPRIENTVTRATANLREEAIQVSDPSPPAWDVFAVAAWQRRQSGARQ